MGSEKQIHSPEPTTAIVAITRNGVELGVRIQCSLVGSRLYAPVRHSFALASGAIGFGRLAEVVPQLWLRHRNLVFIMATGIVVRLVAPLLENKAVDRAVVVLDERGKFVISLVSGHLGGANELARIVAGITGGQSVVTTASDVDGKPAIDLIALEAGLEIENIDRAARLERAILEGEQIWVWDPEMRLGDRLSAIVGCVPLEAALANEEKLRSVPGIWVSEYRAPEGALCLELRPEVLWVGVGCNSGTSSNEILDLIKYTFSDECLSILSVESLASVDLKSGERGILDAAAAIGKPVMFFPRQQLKTVAVPNPSGMVSKHIGVPSVCEAAALLGSRGGKLILTKRKSKNATLAVARVPSML